MELRQNPNTESEAPAADAVRSHCALRLLGFTISGRIVGIICLMTVCAILVAGLFPFCAPRNQVAWVNGENAVRFGKHGTAVSSGRLDFPLLNGACSLEVWLQPARTWATGSLLTFYDASSGRQFAVRQDLSDLALSREEGGGRLLHYSESRLLVPDVFRKQQAFLTVTSNGRETLVYIDGQLALRSSGFRFSLPDLSSRLILGNSALRNRSWSGKLRGVAIYGSALDAAQVAQHYRDWTQRGMPVSDNAELALAVYLFQEHRGNTIHSTVPSGVELEIPERFVVVDQLLLESPIAETHTEQNYLSDVLMNVAGFIPLGFVLNLYFTAVRKMKRAAVAAIVVGMAVSFAIEYFQAFLPTRYSGWTDLITNTIGTAIGVALYKMVALIAARKEWVGPSQAQPIQ